MVAGILFLFKVSLPQDMSQQKLCWNEKLSRLDPFGTLLFITSIVCLLLALQWGGSKHN